MTAAGLQILFRRASTLYGLADGWLERATVLCFVLRYLASHVLPEAWLRADGTLRLQHLKFIASTKGGETATFQEIFRDRIYDRLPEFIPTDDWLIVDVGANIGIFSILQARRGARVYAFEPNPSSYKRLLTSVSESGLGGRVSAFNLALGSRTGIGTLVTDGYTIHGSVSTGSEDTAGTPVRVEVLDHLVSSHGVSHIDLLKIDVEGGELEVLLGGRQTLHIVERIVLEYHSLELLRQVECFLAEHGFISVLRDDLYDGIGLLYSKRLHNASHG